MCKRNPFQISSPGTCGLLLLSPKTVCPFVGWLLSSALRLECASGKADRGFTGAATGTSAVARPGYPSSGDPAIAAGSVQQRCNNGATKASSRAPAVAGKGLAAVPSRGRSCAPAGFLHEPHGVSDDQQEIVGAGDVHRSASFMSHKACPMTSRRSSGPQLCTGRPPS